MSINTAIPEPTDPILISVAVIVASTIARHGTEKAKQKSVPGYGEVIAYGFFLALALLILAVPFPTFAKGLAYLGLVGAFAVNGPAIYKLVGAK